MKLDQKKRIDRLVIYFFYDADGIVDRYVPYMLEDVRKNCSELFVVCNGKLTPEGHATFLRFTPNILVRDNVGFDVWAYKESLEYYGWDKLAEYDEIIMMNYTIMGPVYPFAEMFEEMDRRDLDFWGITAYNGIPVESYDRNSAGIFFWPWHLQSSFIAVRNSMLTSTEFSDYWASMPPVTSYIESIDKHEAFFTKTFCDKGFVCEAYTDAADLKDYTDNPIIKAPVELIRDHRCPIFKRRSFFQPYDDYLRDSTGYQDGQLLEYLKNNTSYDIDLVWETIIRTANIADIKDNLSLEFILPEDYCLGQPVDIKAALVMHIYYADMIEYCYSYARSMPAASKIIVTTDTKEKADKVREVFQQDPDIDLHVELIKNRGRDVSALLVGAAPYLKDYELVCFVHDKKVKQLRYEIIGRTFSERCFQNCLASKEYVQNIIYTMVQNPRLGILCPPPPNFSDYYFTMGGAWGPNFEITKRWADNLDIKAVIREDKELIAPLGSVFWFKVDALKPLLEHGWKYEDFPEEPLPEDGAISHAIERLHSFVAQSQGYYTAWCMTLSQARLEWNNLSFMLREINAVLFKEYGLQTFEGLIKEISVSREKWMRIQIKNKIKALIPSPIWKFLKKVYHLFGGERWVG